MLPDIFINQMRQLLGTDAENMLSSMQEPPVVSIKLNSRKAKDASILGYQNLEPVKWCESGYYLKNRPVFTLNPLLHAGVFYVQDASSMIYEAIIKRILAKSTNSAEHLRILDLCAAPGGKTTSIINAIPDGNLVVANEFVSSRSSILRENLLKWGYPNIIITNSPTSRFAELLDAFDIVAVDAPCSGEGMMRKEETAVTQWNEGLQKQCAGLQREILADASKALKPGGFLIYSTCTFNRLENEDNIKWAVENLGLTPIDMQLPQDWGIASGINTPYPCLRFMPHITRGEGLFVAVFHKDKQPDTVRNLTNKSFEKILHEKLKIICNGIPRTTLKGKETVPTSESVLSTDYQKSLPEVEVDKDLALSYLRHEAIRLEPDTPRGIVLIKYNGFPLGLVKNIGNRANNLYPQAWRIKFI